MKIRPEAFFSYFFNLWMMLIMTGIGFGVLYALPQADEIFIDIGKADAKWHVLLFTEITVLFWSLSLWFSSRLIGRAWLADQLDKVHICTNPRFKWLISNTPRLLGFAIISFFFTSVVKYSSVENLANILYTGLMTLAYILIVFGRRKLFLWIPPANSWMNARWPYFPTQLKVFTLSLAGAYVVLLILFSIPSTSISISQFIGPLAVMCLGLGYISLFATCLRFIDISIKIPTTFLLILYAIIVGVWNNNDEIQQLEEASHVKLKETNIESYFNKWYDSRAKESTEKNTINILLIAGQGGGSRAAYWTSSALAHLDSGDVSFYKSIFAISTVSGSSVGAAFYCAYKKSEQKKANFDLKANRKANIRAIVGRDFLSPNTVPMFFQELLQSLIPIGLPWTDRSKLLEDAWSAAFEDITNDPILDQHFMNIYDTTFQMPLQFYNTTIVERGMQALTAPFLPDTSDFRNQIHLVNSIEKNISLKIAMSLSARFPFFTAPGKVAINDSINLNLADGGYFENTGIGTLLMVYKTLQNVRADRNLNFNVKMIYFQNGKGDYFKSDTELNAFKLVSIPIVALYNSWNTEAAQMYDFAEHTMSRNAKYCDEFIIKKLQYPKKIEDAPEGVLRFPLSRYISKHAKGKIDAQVSTMTLEYKCQKNNSQ